MVSRVLLYSCLDVLIVLYVFGTFYLAVGIEMCFLKCFRALSGYCYAVADSYLALWFLKCFSGNHGVAMQLLSCWHIAVWLLKCFKWFPASCYEVAKVFQDLFF